jgi:hypothetical protein
MVDAKIWGDQGQGWFRIEIKPTKYAGAREYRAEVNHEGLAEFVALFDGDVELIAKEASPSVPIKVENIEVNELSFQDMGFNRIREFVL